MTAPAPHDAGSAELFDYALGRALVGFAFRALRRHWGLALGAFVLTMSAAIAALAVMPRTYRTEVRLLTARNQVMPGLANPGRAVPRDADAPTQAASELVLRHDNLVALIKQTNLLDQWDDGRAPLVRAKDWVSLSIHGRPAEEDRLDALVGLLEKRLKVTTGEGGTVTIEIEWPDAQMAYQLVEAAQQNFIETRHTLEVSTITEAITILEWHASAMRTAVQATLEDLRKPRDAAAAPPRVGGKTLRPVAAEPRPRQPQESQELNQSRAMLAARQRALADLEDYRRRRLAELQGVLAEQTAIYAPAHPLVVATQVSVAAMSKESPQTDSLKREIRELEREVSEREAARAVVTAAAAVAHQLPSRQEPIIEALREVALATTEDHSIEYLRAKLKMSIDKYQDLLGRIDGARIELDTARAAFKYRYSVIRPAQVPKLAERPRPASVLGGGLVAALLLALFASMASDLRNGRIVEAWQVEKVLGVPVLIEMRRS